MSLITLSPENYKQGQFLCISPGESEEGRDVGSTSVVEFFRYDSIGKISISHSTTLKSVIRAATWTKHEKGVLALGADDGSVYFPKLNDFFINLPNDEDAVDLSKSQKEHSGPVSSFDWNHFQPNLVCSGSADSSVYIWDLNKPDTHMVPGQGSTSVHSDPILTVAWNLQVQHILGTASSSKATIWDLRKSEPVIRLTDGLCRLKPELLCWSPNVATQLLVASSDYSNATPAIQLWDLKQPTAPVKTFTGFKEGMTSLSWCPQDSNLLLSSGKDGNLLLWDPVQGCLVGNILPDCHVVSQGETIAVKTVAWSPIDAGLFIALMNDGTACLHNILSGSQAALGFGKTAINRERKASRREVLDAFGQLDSDITKEMSKDDLSEMVVDAPSRLPLKPPNWMLSTCSSRFSFGNRLVMCSATAGRVVTINQITTDEMLVERAGEVSAVMHAQAQTKKDVVGKFVGQRASSCEDADLQMVWKFMDASLSDQRLPRYMQLLGVDLQSVPEKVYNATGKILENMPTSPSASMATSTMSAAIANTNGGEANGEPYVEATESYALPESDKNSKDALIVEGLLCARPELAIDACLNAGRFSDALVLSASANQDLFSKTLQYVMKSARDPISRLISGICLGDLDSVASCLDVGQWPTCLGIILTYAMDKEYQADLAECLADRLEDALMFGPAAVCHLVSTNISSFSKCIGERISERKQFRERTQINNTKDLLEHAELLLSYAASLLPKSAQGDVDLDDDSIKTLTHYCKMLIEQGELSLAFEVVKMTPNNKLALLELRHRLYHSLKLSPRQTGLPLPSVPFRQFDIKTSPSLVLSQRSSMTTEDSFGGHLQTPATTNGGVSFQLGGKPMTMHQAQVPHPVQAPAQPSFPQYSAAEPPKAPQQPTMYTAGGQVVEQISPDSSNVLAPASGPAVPSFYDPTAHRQHTLPASSASPGYHQPQPTSAYPQYPQQPRQFQPSPSPQPVSAGMFTPSQPPPPPTQRPPSQLQQPIQPPPMPGQIQQQTAQFPPPQPSMRAEQQQPQFQQPFQPPPVSAAMAPQPYQQQQQQQQQYQPQAPPMPAAAPLPPPPPMTSQVQTSFPSALPSVSGGSIARPSYPPPVSNAYNPGQQPQLSPARPAFQPVQTAYNPSQPSPAVPSFPPASSAYNPAAFNQQPQQQQMGGYPPSQQNMMTQPPPPQQPGQMYNPNSAAPPQSYNNQPPPPPASSDQPQQHTAGIPRVRSYIDRRPSNNWNDPPVNVYTPLGVNTNANDGTAGPQPSPGAVPNQPPQPALPPLSPELQPIVDALGGLLSRCLQTAPHGTKKKLEDVEKKMPMLFEKLHLQKVSPAIIQCLLQLSAALKNSDYHTATNVCQHMAGVGPFAEVGQFMLPIKVLVHTAQQLNIRM